MRRYRKGTRWFRPPAGADRAGGVNKTTQRQYHGELIEIRTRGGRKLACTPNHICFGRLDRAQGAHYVYLMQRKDKGYRIGVTSGARSSKDNAALNGLMVRTNQEVADAMWILRTCRSAAEARYHEQFFSVTYGLPTALFHTRGRQLVMGQDLIDRLYREIDTEAAAERPMDDLG